MSVAEDVPRTLRTSMCNCKGSPPPLPQAFLTILPAMLFPVFFPCANFPVGANAFLSRGIPRAHSSADLLGPNFALPHRLSPLSQAVSPFIPCPLCCLRTSPFRVLLDYFSPPYRSVDSRAPYFRPFSADSPFPKRWNPVHLLTLLPSQRAFS